MSDGVDLPSTGAERDADVWEEASNWNEAEVEPDDVASGETLANLGLLYLHHGDHNRALVLGLTALSLGDASPRTALLIADALLRNGDSEQVLAVLSRFDDKANGLTRQPEIGESGAKDYLKALALYRSGRPAEARDVLERATAALESLR